MGAIGSVIGGGAEERRKLLSTALSASPRGGKQQISRRGDVTIGVTGGGLDDGYLSDGTSWSVAVTGVVDTVGDEDRVSQPAESISRAMDRLGVEAAKTVVGDFNCLATNGRRLIAFRDHLGTDGMFVGTNDRTTAVMSEPKQVVSALERRRTVDIDALVSMFFSQWQSEDDVPCPVSGVERVPRGHVIEATNDGWSRVTRIWDPSESVETSKLSAAQAEDAGWEMIRRAVERSVGGPTAVSLSGGIDSTLIAAALASVDPEERIGAVSAIYPESPTVDESPYISQTTSYLGIDSVTYESRGEQLDDLESWVDKFDGPTHGLGVHAIDDLNVVAASEGYQTILSGEMAELVYDLREHAIGSMFLRGRFQPAVRNLRQLRGRGLPWPSLARMVGSTLTPQRLALAYSRRQPIDPPTSWLDPSFMPGLQKRWDFERPPNRRWRDIQQFFAMGPSYPGLELSTLMGDLAGVRTRRPLVDRELWSFFLSLPPEIKFPDAWTKALVRRSLAGHAPDSVVWRTDKTVFDEDSKRNVDYQWLLSRLHDGFQLPGVHYEELFRRIESKEMSSFELSAARNLASIHAFVAVV